MKKQDSARLLVGQPRWLSAVRHHGSRLPARLRATPPSFRLSVAFTALLVWLAVLAAPAQGLSAYAFGINYTQDGLSAGKTADLKKARMNIIRLGGNERNNKIKWRNKYDWVNDIEYVKYTLNAEPIVQLPIGLPPSEVPDWVYFFNVTKGYNIKFWTIGNEPDPSGDELAGWLGGTPFNQSTTNGLPNNFNYSQWEARFIGLANALKQYDGNAKIVGPDFRLFYQEAISSMYARFLTNVGSRAVTGNAGLPLLDYFSFHYYPKQADAESVLKARFSAVQNLLNQANGQRPWADLRMALTEFNGEKTGTALPWWFNTGQFVATMAKLSLSYDAFCMTPWSVYENGGSRTGTDFSFYNTDDSRRPTMHHFAMLSENRRANYMPPAQANFPDQVVALGMREAHTANAGYTIMLMNTSGSTRSFNISLNNAYQGTASNVQIKFAGYAGVTNTPLTGSIPPTTTFLFRCDANGNFVSKLVFSEQDGAPHFRSATVASAGPPTPNSASPGVYPNPATTSVTIAVTAESSRVRLRDMTGRVCRAQTIGRDGQLDVQGLAKGLYTLTVATHTGEVHHKLVKE